jgi:hypothetical protein
MTGLTLQNTTGGTSITRKGQIASVGANAPRVTYASGIPVGCSFFEAKSHLVGRTRPYLSQVGFSTGAANGSVTGWNAGNVITLADATVNRYIGYTLTQAAGDYLVQVVLRLSDGSLPVVCSFSNRTGADVDVGASTFINNPDTGAVGLKVTALSDGWYLCEGYVTHAGGVFYPQISKVPATGMSNKSVDISYFNVSPGRTPIPIFHNTTGTPNSRAVDVLKTTLTGFTADEFTIIGEFVCPYLRAYSASITYLGDATGQNRIWFNMIPNSTAAQFLVVTGGVVQFAFDTAILTPGQSYKFAVSISKRSNRAVMKIKGTGAAVSYENSNRVPTYTPPDVMGIELGTSYNTGLYALNSAIALIALDDRAWSDANLTSWVGV